jgi:hypothetical protein
MTTTIFNFKYYSILENEELPKAEASSSGRVKGKMTGIYTI